MKRVAVFSNRFLIATQGDLTRIIFRDQLSDGAEEVPVVSVIMRTHDAKALAETLLHVLGQSEATPKP